jgi:hypothetical protein
MTWIKTNLNVVSLPYVAIIVLLAACNQGKAEPIDVMCENGEQGAYYPWPNAIKLSFPGLEAIETLNLRVSKGQNWQPAGKSRAYENARVRLVFLRKAVPSSNPGWPPNVSIQFLSGGRIASALRCSTELTGGPDEWKQYFTR